MKLRNIILTLGSVIAVNAGSAFAVTSFTETFNTNASGWLNGDSGAPIYNSTGGIDNSGYISFIPATFTSTPGMGDPLKLMFRGNDAANASGDAFVGNWISNGVETFSLSVRHNYSTSLNLYTRIAGSGGAGASLANIYSIAPNTWTTITIPITDTNPPFLSYGSSSFSGVFSNVLNLQLGLYLPTGIEFTGLRMDIDNVSITAVPEPHEYALGVAGLMAVAIFVRRRRMAVQA